MKKVLWKQVALVAAVSISLLGCAGKTDTSGGNKSEKNANADQTYTIKYAMTQGGTDPEESGEVMFVETFKKEVEEKSGGRIKVDIYPNGQLGTGDEFVQGVIANSIEMASINITLLDNLYKQNMVISSPGVFASEEETNEILSGEWGKEHFQEMEDSIGVKMIAPICNGFRSFTTSNKELTTVDTAKGVTFRVMQSPVMIKMVEALGAKAVPMAGAEMYTAMQNGTVDGQENPVVNILNDKTYEVQKYLVLDKHVVSVNAVVMNSTFYNSLPQDLQQIIDEASVNSAEAAKNVFNSINEKGIKKLEEYGMSVYIPTDSELEAWHEKILMPCQEYIRSEIGDEVVDGLLEAIESYRR